MGRKAGYRVGLSGGGLPQDVAHNLQRAARPLGLGAIRA